jgi:hypothetical protein
LAAIEGKHTIRVQVIRRESPKIDVVHAECHLMLAAGHAQVFREFDRVVGLPRRRYTGSERAAINAQTT